MPEPRNLSRPWRSVPRATPAFSQLSLTRTNSALCIESPTCRWSFGLMMLWMLLIEALLSFCASWSASLSSSCNGAGDGTDDDSGTAAGGSVDSSCVLISMLPLALPIAAVIFAVGSYYTLQRMCYVTFSVSGDAWAVKQWRPLLGGLWWSCTSASGSVHSLSGAQVASVAAEPADLATAIEYATGKEAPRSVYSASAATCSPLSLTEQEFVASEVNHFLEAALGHKVPSSIENSVPCGAAAAPEATENFTVHQDFTAAPFADGAPFARPHLLISTLRPAASRLPRLSTSGHRSTTFVALPRAQGRWIVTNLIINLVFALFFSVMTAIAVVMGVKETLSREDHSLPPDMPLLLIGGAAVLAVFFSWLFIDAALVLARRDTLEFSRGGWRLQQCALPIGNCSSAYAVGSYLRRSRRIVDKGSWEGVVGFRVIATRSGPSLDRGAIFRLASVHGTLAVVHADGSQHPLVFRSAYLSVQDLEYLAATANAALADLGGPPATSAPENETVLSPLADLRLPPVCVTRSSTPGDTSPPSTKQRADSLLQQQAEWLQALSGASPAALAALRALQPICGPRVEVSTHPRLASATLRPGLYLPTVRAIPLLCVYLAGLALVAISGNPWFVWAFILAFLLALRLCAQHHDVSVEVTLRRWSIRRSLFGASCGCASGHTSDLLGCEVNTAGKASSALKLELRTSQGTQVLSAVDSPAQSLREKVTVMRQINLFLASLKDAAEDVEAASPHDDSDALKPLLS